MVSYNARRTRGERYLETDLAPRYPFGFGLSYTEFRYGRLTVEPAVVPIGGEATVRIDVTNAGAWDGAEVVQLYVSDLAASVTRPEKALKGFRKVFLKAGETQEVTFTIGSEQLELIGLDLKPVVEPGEFRIQVGPDSTRGEIASLMVRVKGRMVAGVGLNSFQPSSFHRIPLVAPDDQPKALPTR